VNLPANHLLVLIAVPLVFIDAAWAAAGGFNVDITGYLALLILSAGLSALGFFYSRARPDPNLAAMLFGASFLCTFSAGADFLNYLLLTVAGHPIDETLAGLDRAVGFDWPGLIGWAAAHPRSDFLLREAYETSLPQIAALIVCLGLFRQPEKIHGFCIALAIGAGIAIGFWTLFPSFGAFAVYHLPEQVALKANAALNGNYARELSGLLAHGPGRIGPREVKGLIGFPSFHTVMALLTIWYARKLPVLRWVALALNVLVIASTPIHGGHHLVDLFGGMATACAAVWLSARILAAGGKRQATPFAPLGQTPAFPSV
jgi:hypothetical protein